MTHEHMKLLLADMITDKEYHPILIIDNENNDGRNIVYDITMTLGYK